MIDMSTQIEILPYRVELERLNADGRWESLGPGYSSSLVTAYATETEAKRALVLTERVILSGPTPRRFRATIKERKEDTDDPHTRT
jgi:hypothetical protein